MIKEWNESPFGRRLHLLVHRLPRRCKAGRDWELERGFHLSVVDGETFELTLAPRGKTDHQEVPLSGGMFTDGQKRFLIWHCPGCYRADGLEPFARLLSSREGVDVGLILSKTEERSRALADYPRHRAVWQAVRQPVLQVFQDFPDSTFFSVEKNLFDLGRVGRRLVKLGRWRRLMPW